LRLILSEAADADLVDIGVYTIEQWGMGQADIYVGGLIAQMNAVAAGEAHAAKITMIAGMNRVRSGLHHIYYRIEGDAIIVIRILHERMDPARHLS
jgi:toxin ParE1/3/4